MHVRASVVFIRQIAILVECLVDREYRYFVLLRAIYADCVPNRGGGWPEEFMQSAVTSLPSVIIYY